MRLCSTAAEVRELDRRVIEDLGLPGVALMELASAGVAAVIREHHLPDARRGTVVVCGSGNNGGDGWAVARWLHGWGVPVSVWALAEPRSGSDAEVMARVCRRMGVGEVDGLGDAGLIVDAVLGTGLDRPVTGRIRDVLVALADHRAPIVAVDLPSGLHADRGEVLGSCPAAVRTVTFGRAKIGMYGGDGPSRCGRVHVVDIGLDAGPGPVTAAAELCEAHDLQWPRRSAGDHKGSSGHLLVVAGSAAMAGAAVLCCRGALAAGAGLVTLVVPAGARSRLAALPPEVMVVDGGPGDHLRGLPDLGRYDAVAAGPGLGGGQALSGALAAALCGLWRDDPRALVFDADALPSTEIPASTDLRRVLTPHPGEAGRLLGLSAAEVEADRFGAVHRLSDRGVALLKGRYTLVADGTARTSINPTGAPTLATGGSGDVLTGVIGALLARGVTARGAARLAAWVHGRAGELLAERRAEGWGASDVADAIPAAIATL